MMNDALKKSQRAKQNMIRSSATDWNSWRNARNEVLAALDGKAARYGRLRLHPGEPEEYRSKRKLSVECLECGLGRDGSFETYFDNVRLSPQGCPICKCVDPLRDRVKAIFPRQSLQLCPVEPGPPNVPSLRFVVRPQDWMLPDDFGWDMPSIGLAAVKKGLREYLLPSGPAHTSYRDFVKLHSTFKDKFHLGTIRFAGDHHPETTSPGPFFAVATGARLLRAPLAGEYVSRAAVLKAVQQEAKDAVLHDELLAEAKRYEATEVAFEWSPGKGGGFYIFYRSRTGFYHLDTRWRARDKAWGQSGFRRGEALALVIISHLFPANDWRRASRPDFLLRDNGHKLELDAYSPQLRLALEYHGAHHYSPRSQSAEDHRIYDSQIQRDAEKRALCREAKVTLLEMKDRPLSPAVFLSCIQDLVREAGLVPTCATPDLGEITELWTKICENPLKDFQDALQRNLGNHNLVSHELTQVTKGCNVVYECGHCGERNTAQAKGLVEGSVRRYCPQCRGDVNAGLRRAEMLNAWALQGMPTAVIERVEFDDSGTRQYRCEANHMTVLHDFSSAFRHVVDGVFECPKCLNVLYGVAPSHATQFATYSKDFSESLAKVNLTVQGALWYENNELFARIRCPAGHERSISRPFLSRILSNSNLTDLSVVPSACPDCAYPGVEVASELKLMGTLHHRLEAMKGMYPGITYIEGFDVGGRRKETFSCGFHGSDGKPHPPFSISFFNLQRYAQRRSDKHLCLSCEVEAGSTNRRGKSLVDISSRMAILRASVLAVTPANRRPAEVQPPKATLISEPFGGRGDFSTTKAIFRFECGVPGHTPIERSYDSYFHSRNFGFCPACVKNAGLKDVPRPKQSRRISGALRLIVLRNN